VFSVFRVPKKSNAEDTKHTDKAQSFLI